MATGEVPAPLVLVAEDDEDIRSLVRVRLERAGYRVVAAAHGMEAFELALEHAPDLAVLDVTMPRSNGYELTRRLRAHERTSKLPVILLTARAQDDDVRSGLAAGADVYLRKPFSPQELIAQVEAMLRRG
jgi:DNA-binding response OmpR family regulator